MKQVLSAWHAIDEFIQKIERALIVIGLATIMIAGMLNIALRLAGYPEIALTGVILKQFTLWLGLLGAALATASREHLNVDALSRTLSKRSLDLHKVLVGLVCVVGSAYLTFLAYKFFRFQGPKMQSEFVGGGQFAWLWVVIFPVSFAMMTLRYFFQTVEYGGILFSPELATDPQEERSPLAEELADAPKEAASSTDNASTIAAAKGDQA